MTTAQGLPSPVTEQPRKRICRPIPQPFLPRAIRCPMITEAVLSGSSSPEDEAHLGLIPGTFSALEAPALLLKESLSTLLPLREGAESEMV